MTIDAKSRLIVALDVPTVEEAHALIDRLGASVAFYKVGLWLLHAPGIDGLLDRLADAGKEIFLDCKMYDIGETVREGVKRAAARGVSFVTVHGNRDILRAAVEGKSGTSLKIFAISVLTNLDDDDMREMGYLRPVGELIDIRVQKALEYGCDGLIAAPQDAQRIRRVAPAGSLLLGTPGVRPAGYGQDDHKRGGNPASAIEDGSDYIIMGRPIIRADDPPAVARSVTAEMQSAFDVQRNKDETNDAVFQSASRGRRTRQRVRGLSRDLQTMGGYQSGVDERALVTVSR